MTEHEELLMLRALVDKQKAELAKKDQLIEKQNVKIQKQNIQIENMIQALLHTRKKIFGASTEAVSENQISLFNETQALATELLKQEKNITIATHQRTARKIGVRAEMLAALPTDVEEYVINPNETCSICGGKLKEIGKRIVRTEVQYFPAKLKVVHVVQQVMKCTVCGTGKNDNPKDHFQKAKVPTSVLPHSIATPSLVAQIMYGKFLMGIPLNRQEKDWYRLGLILPRSNMAHWMIRCSEEWLQPIYERIHSELLKCCCLHMDETRIQCNKEDGRKASSNSFMWVIRSGASEPITATYFYYSPSRSGEIAKKLLEGYDKYLTTDAYIGYEKVEGIKRNLCWAHVRRYFIESIPLDDKGKEIPGSKGAEGRGFIDLLFKIEDQ